MALFRAIILYTLVSMHKHRDVYMGVYTAILKLKGIDVLCANLRYVYMDV